MPQVFRSWQQIAAYVGKGTRTVQRWEREIDFPVHRPCAGDGRQVIAFADEIDNWLRRSTAVNTPPTSVKAALESRREEVLKLREQVEKMREQTAIIRDRLTRISNERDSRQAKLDKVAITVAGKW